MFLWTGVTKPVIYLLHTQHNMLLSWTCWEPLCYLTARGWLSHFTAWCATTLHFCGVLQSTCQLWRSVGMSWPIPWPPRSPDIRHLIFWGYVMDIVYASWVDGVKDLPPKNIMVATAVTPALLRRLWSEFCHILKPS